MAKCKKFTGGKDREIAGISFFCLGCNHRHVIYTKGYDTNWQWNGDVDLPTVSPSIVVKGNPLCHSFIRNGFQEYLGDCTHSLAGKTVEMPDLETLAEDAPASGQ